jgi:hypothetical protein
MRHCTARRVYEGRCRFHPLTPKDQLAPSQDSLATNGLAFLKDLFARVEY